MPSVLLGGGAGLNSPGESGHDYGALIDGSASAGRACDAEEGVGVASAASERPPMVSQTIIVDTSVGVGTT